MVETTSVVKVSPDSPIAATQSLSAVDGELVVGELVVTGGSIIGLGRGDMCEWVTTGVRIVELEVTAALGTNRAAVADRLLGTIDTCEQSRYAAVNAGCRRHFQLLTPFSKGHDLPE